jgi:signal transduction histidine kinase
MWPTSRIGLRLLAFNILVVFVPIVGVLYLDVYETQLLEAQERAMVQRARILAAAAGGSSEIDREATRNILARLARRNDARLRVFDRTGAPFAAVLTMVAAATIVTPLTRLRRAAASLAERRRRLPHDFPGTRRSDEIGELARALEDVTHRLSAHIALLEGFAADVSHEFKNPLAGIRTAAEAIEACDPAERSRFIVLMLRDVERLERLVSSLRELARIAGRLEQGEIATVDLGELLHTVAEGLRLRTESAVRIVVRSPDGRCPVAGDVESLTQVFENLLANAVSFSPNGSDVEMQVVETTDGVA